MNKQQTELRKPLLEVGAVVKMKASSDLKGYGNEQCINWYSEPLGEIGLYGHNQGYKTYDVERIISSPSQKIVQAQQEAREEERKEIFRIISEELHDTQPDPYKGWVDYINMDVDDFLDELEKALQKESK